MKKIPLHWQIVASSVLSIVVTMVIRGMELDSEKLVSVCDFLGQIFMNALRMIVIPVIVTSVLSGMFNMGDAKGFRRLGMKTLMYYVGTSLVAITVGLLLVNIIQPGKVDLETAQAIIGQSANPEIFLENVQGKSGADLVDIFVRMVPPNIFDVLSQNSQLLGVIFASLLIGFFLNSLTGDKRELQVKFWSGLQETMIRLTKFVCQFIPIGVFALVTPVFLRTGVEIIQPLSWFFATVMLGLLIHAGVVMYLVLRYVGGVKPLMHYRVMKEVVLTAFSTSSSAATLPLTLETLEVDSKVSNKVASFTLPLGATVNMDGTALYECIVVLFIAQFYSVIGSFEITVTTQITVVMLALLTSIGVAGIPSASLVAITVILGAVGLPLEAIGLVIAVDRVLDMCRTAVNVFGDSVGAVVIARSEGEQIYEAAR